MNEPVKLDSIKHDAIKLDAIGPLYRYNKDGSVIRDATGERAAAGWRANPFGYKLGTDGRFGTKTVARPRNFAPPLTIEHAIKYRERIYDQRDKIVADRLRGICEETIARTRAFPDERGSIPPAPVAPIERGRTLAQMIDHFLHHKSFVSKSESTKETIRFILADLAEWAVRTGRPYATDWTEEVADERIHYLCYEWTPRISPRRVKAMTAEELAAVPRGRQGSGVNPHAIYSKKLFALECARKDSAIFGANPWPPLEKNSTITAKVEPRPYTHEELSALFEHADSYTHLLFRFLYSIGCRTEELLGLKREHVEFDRSRPTRIHFVESTGRRLKTRNSIRTIDLSPQAADAVTGLWLAGDGSHLLVRRDFTHGKGGTGVRKTTPLLDALWETKKKAAAAYPHLRHAFFDRVDPGNPRSRFITCVHSFRDTFVTELLEQNVNVVTIAQLIGDTVETLTAHYAGILNKSKKEAVMMLPEIKFGTKRELIHEH